MILVIGINLITAQLLSDCGLSAIFGLDTCADDIARAGWPLKFYEEGGFAYRMVFNPLALGFDIGVGLALSAGLGWLFAGRSTA